MWPPAPPPFQFTFGAWLGSSLHLDHSPDPDDSAGRQSEGNSSTSSPGSESSESSGTTGSRSPGREQEQLALLTEMIRGEKTREYLQSELVDCKSRLIAFQEAFEMEESKVLQRDRVITFWADCD